MNLNKVLIGFYFGSILLKSFLSIIKEPMKDLQRASPVASVPIPAPPLTLVAGPSVEAAPPNEANQLVEAEAAPAANEEPPLAPKSVDASPN